MAYEPIVKAVADGGTGQATLTSNCFLAGNGTSPVTIIATGNSGVLDTTTGGVPQIDTTNFSVLSTGVKLKGNNAVTAPPAGFIGEQISTYIPVGSIVSLATGTAKTITSINITAGIWDVSALTAFQGNASTVVTQLNCSISPNTNTLGGNFGDDTTNFTIAIAAGNVAKPILFIPSFRVLLSATTTYYLVANASFTVSTLGAFGRISATRVG